MVYSRVVLREGQGHLVVLAIRIDEGDGHRVARVSPVVRRPGAVYADAVPYASAENVQVVDVDYLALYVRRVHVQACPST